jgi:hypothetical protein
MRDLNSRLRPTHFVGGNGQVLLAGMRGYARNVPLRDRRMRLRPRRRRPRAGLPTGLNCTAGWRARHTVIGMSLVGGRRLPDATGFDATGFDATCFGATCFGATCFGATKLGATKLGATKLGAHGTRCSRSAGAGVATFTRSGRCVRRRHDRRTGVDEVHAGRRS